MQCWDADLLSSDDHLGTVELDLANMVRGTKTSADCKASILRSEKRPRLNLFRAKKHKGWWPFVTVDPASKKPKLTGKVEAEFLLLTEEEATAKPAGRGHDEPDALPLPIRPKDSFLWFTSPLRTLRFVVWKNHKCIILKVIFLLLVILFVFLFIYQLPSIAVTKIVEKIG